MAFWAKLQSLTAGNSQQIREIYSGEIPIEVRHLLAAYIEDKFWELESLINKKDGHEQEYIAKAMSEFISEIERKALALDGPDVFFAKEKLCDFAKAYRLKYCSNPIDLYIQIRNCLAMEMHILHSFGEECVPGCENFPVPNYRMDILEKLRDVRERTEDAANHLRQLKQDQESYAISFHDFLRINQTLQSQSHSAVNLKVLTAKKDEMELKLTEKGTKIINSRIELRKKFEEILNTLSTIQSKILDEELISWKRRQQLAGNGVPFNDNLGEIQKWCEELAKYIWKNRQLLKEAEQLQSKLNLDNNALESGLHKLKDQITGLLSSLVTSSFIIEKQPPQVLKTNTRIQATIRLLVAAELNIYMTPPEVKVCIVSENQANTILKSDKTLNGLGDSPIGEIINSTGMMEFNSTTRQLSVAFRNMQLKKIKRAEKKSTESVMDEKFSLFFQSKFYVGGGELMFHVWTLSLPVVVIVHGNQEPHALATITWDNAFSEPGRTPFVVPDKIPWCSVAEMLSIRFNSATDRHLNESNLLFLAKKAFRGNFIDANQYLAWSWFSKDPLPDRAFTFWEWFYAVMKVTREHLKSIWCRGLIHGFIQKREAEEMLSSCESGTFLLRFSDSELGGISIAAIVNGQVSMTTPFTSKDFVIRSLPDRLNDFESLKYLYPNTPKDQVFCEFYTRTEDEHITLNTGYVKPMLKTHLPVWSESSSFTSFSNPNTPQSQTYNTALDIKLEMSPSITNNSSAANATVHLPNVTSPVSVISNNSAMFSPEHYGSASHSQLDAMNMDYFESM